MTVGIPKSLPLDMPEEKASKSTTEASIDRYVKFMSLVPIFIAVVSWFRIPTNELSTRVAATGNLITAIGVSATVTLTWILVRNDIRRSQRESDAHDSALRREVFEKEDAEKTMTNEAAKKREEKSSAIVADMAHEIESRMFSGTSASDLLISLALSDNSRRAALIAGYDLWLRNANVGTLDRARKLEEILQELDEKEPSTWPGWETGALNDKGSPESR